MFRYICEFDSGRYYLYHHIRKDTGEPFYIGIGTKPSDKWGNFMNIYNRSYCKSGRSKEWKEIAKNGYEIEILIECGCYEFLTEKEKEFIKLYGRVDNSTGILVNLTDGGGGPNNYKQSAETIEKRVKHLRGKSRSKETKEKIRQIHKGRTMSPETIESFKKAILQYDLQGNFIKEWDSLSKVSRELGASTSSLSKCCRGEKQSVKSYIWLYKEGDIKDKIEARKTKQIPVDQFTTEGDFIQRFNSCKEAERITGINSGTIQAQINKNLPLKYNVKFIWKKVQ